VFQVGGESYLPKETLDDHGAADFFAQDLYRDATVIPAIDAAINGRHSAAPDETLDDVAVGDYSGKGRI